MKLINSNKIKLNINRSCTIQSNGLFTHNVGSAI